MIIPTHLIPCKVDIKKMEIEWYTPEGKLWYYCAPCFEGENIPARGNSIQDKVHYGW